mmetsp:Transcript_1480/g.4031  ORF Transcript_1480/g.4031 Transcript_1480/m.4031 type:complete len:261 (-) Transcript_1480:833-1615(-)
MLLEVRRRISPVAVGCMVVDDMVILVPDVVVPLQDGNGVHVLVARVRLLHEGVPEVGNGTEQHASLHVGIDPIGQAEEWTPAPDEHGDAVISRHALEQLPQQSPLPTLCEQGCRAQAGPIECEARRVNQEGAQHRAIQVQVRVHIIDVVVPPVVDLHVGDAVVVGHHAVEGRDPPLDYAIEALETASEKTLVVVPSLVDNGVRVGEELEAWANAEDVVDGKRGELQAVRGMPPERPEEKRRREETKDEQPRQVGVVPRVP